jgi:DNA-directed RNA polymerase specialized sigma24 family protein
MTASKNGPGTRVPTDTALIAAARRGDVDAFDSLVDRHRDAAVTLARRTIDGHTEDLVDATVAAVRTELRAGAGPATAFRPYLLAAVRRQYAVGTRRRRPQHSAPAPEHALPAACVQRTAKAFRALPEDAQAAIWHTEVESEPLLETGKLLGVEATKVAELSFAARDTLRAAQLLEHRAAIRTAECRWTTNRLTGYARNTLPEADTATVAAHLDTCELCGKIAPSVVALEADLALLLATAVLGPAAAAYLDREGAAIVRPAGFAGLMRDAARPVAVAISAIALITAGLLGTLAFADEDGARTKTASPSVFTAIPVAPITPVADDRGPDSGSGSTGRDAAAAPRPAPRALVPVSSARETVSDVKSDPAAPAPAPQTEEPSGKSLNLGIVKLTLTPGAGILGLPGLSFG